ncbi:hypothetical protein [Amycolatopsis sp.]|uniref:hypothetical protein n=1 Tax=Amycolatopsis sp. TaxID=37632 RepID=UPI002B467044|nr:hypothetical protein [Amycolatopsis sp.]
MRHTVARVGRYALTGLFGSWFFITLLSQDPRRKFEKLRKFDPSGVFIADWRFFAPRPGMHDYHVLVRDQLVDGKHTDWTEICPAEARRWHHALWYINRRVEKVVADSVSGLMDFGRLARKKEDIQLSGSYLTLLNYVTSSVPHHKDADRTQFLVAASDGYDEQEEPTILFMSNAHPLT